MKKLLTILFIYLSLFSFGQNYTPMLKDGHQFSQSFVEVMNWDVKGVTQYYVKKDTLVNGKVYKLFYGQQVGGAYWLWTFCKTPCKAALLREDTILKKIYKYPGLADDDTSFYGLNEFVLYDYNLNVGDSVFSPKDLNGLVNYYDYYSIDSIGYIKPTKGDSLKSYFTKENNNYRRLYSEGVFAGSLRFSITHGTYFPMTTCTFDNTGTLIFSSDTLFPCETYFFIGVTENKKSVTEYFPNPVYNKLFVNSQKEGQLIILSMNGQIMRKEPILKGQNEIEISQLNNGIYVIRFVYQNTIVTDLLLKN